MTVAVQDLLLCGSRLEGLLSSHMVLSGLLVRKAYFESEMDSPVVLVSMYGVKSEARW